MGFVKGLVIGVNGVIFICWVVMVWYGSLFIMY